MSKRFMFILRGMVTSVVKGAMWAIGVLLAMVAFNFIASILGGK